MADDRQEAEVMGVEESKVFLSDPIIEDSKGFLSDKVIGVDVVRGGSEEAGPGGGLYGESLEMLGGEMLEVDPEVGGLFDFLGRLLFPLAVPFCCCCCC